MSVLLDIKNLSVGFPHKGDVLTICNDVSFKIDKSQSYCLLGESGSGKSVLAQALIGLQPAPGEILSGSVIFDGIDFLTLDEKQQRTLMGKRIGFLFQNAKTSLHPLHRVGRQIIDVLKLHEEHTTDTSQVECMRLLSMMKFNDPNEVAEKYPHELSGGMAQRAALAVALAGKPDLLITDEPTAALDINLRDEIIDLLIELRSTLSLSLFVITHDLEVAKRLGGQTALFYAGQIIEEAPSAVFLNNPKHPYACALIDCYKRIEDNPQSIKGEAPDFDQLPSGCNFYNRCPRALPTCESIPPQEVVSSKSERVLCHLMGGP